MEADAGTAYSLVASPIDRKEVIMLHSTLHTSPMSLHGSHESYELRFQSLFNEGRALAFPCDCEGHVDIDSLSETARRNYMYARALIGREFSTPAVLEKHTH